MALPLSLLRPSTKSLYQRPILSLPSNSASLLLRLPSRPACRRSLTHQPFGRGPHAQQQKLRESLNTSTTRQYATVVVQNNPRSRTRRYLVFLLISTTSFLIGTQLSLHYLPASLGLPLIMGSHRPSDAETLEMYTPPDTFSAEIDAHIREHPLSQQLRADPSWRESRPHLKIPEGVRQHNLTAGTLAGPGMIVVPPYYFNKKDGSEMVQILYVGTDVSGHPGIVHGGFIATLLDEGLARCAFPAMQNKVGVTANLQINYRKPTMAGQFLVLRAQTTKVDGRKAWAKGWIESLEEEVAEGEEKTKLVEAEALFIEPKGAKVMQSLYRVAT